MDLVSSIGSWNMGDHMPALLITMPRAYEGQRRRFELRNKQQFRQIDWKGVPIVPVTKELFVEHTVTGARFEKECNRIRQRHSINIRHDGRDEVPKPTESVEKVPILDWIVQAMRHKDSMQPTAVLVQAWPVAA